MGLHGDDVCRAHRLRSLYADGRIWRHHHSSNNAGWSAKANPRAISGIGDAMALARGGLDHCMPIDNCCGVGGGSNGGPGFRRIPCAELAKPQGATNRSTVAAAWIASQFALLPYESPANSPVVVGGAAGGLFVLLVGGCLAAPIMEEFVFRGFMFRGWSESFLGPVGAILLTSTLFGMYHTQYDWLGRFWIFLFGLAMCTVRWRSNSTWVTVVVHSAVNIVLFFCRAPTSRAPSPARSRPAW